MNATPERYLPSRDVAPPSRWNLIRDVAVFQLKLFLDGLRDLVLVPISLGLAALDLLGVGARAGHHFYDLLHLGKRTERYIDLFGAADRTDPFLAMSDGAGGVDALVGRVERVIRQEYERGGMTSSAKKAVDRALDGLQRGGK